MEMNHANEEQWDELLMSRSREAEQLQALVNGLPESARSAAERREMFWDRQRLSIQRQIANLPQRRATSARLAWAAVFALILIASFLLKTGSRVPVQPTAPDSDRELLVQVEQALDGDVPQALQPASLIANEIDQAAQARSNLTTSKENSAHEN
jgi:hypothetical protein